MANVTELDKHRELRKPENNYCFQCPCGGQDFILRPDAKIQCWDCKEIQARLIWGEFFRSDHINPPDQT